MGSSVDLNVVWTSTSANVIRVGDLGVTAGAPDIRSLHFFGAFGDKESQTSRLELNMRTWIDKQLLAAVIFGHFRSLRKELLLMTRKL